MNDIKRNRFKYLHNILNILNRTRSLPLYNNAFYLMLNTAFTAVLGFVFWNIMARSFSHVEVGIGTVLISATGLIGAFSNFGMGVGLMRFVPEVGRDAPRLNNSAFTMTASIAAVSALIYLSGINTWAPALLFIKENIWLLLLFILFTVTTAIYLLADQSLVAGRAARYVFWKNAFASILKIPLPVLLFSSMKGYGIFTGTGVAMLLAVMLTLFVFIPRVYEGFFPKPVLAKDILSKVLPYSFSNYLANLLNQTPNYIYPLIVINVLGPKYSAYFYMAWIISMVLTIIPSSFAQSLFAEGAHNPHSLGHNGWRALLLSLFLTAPAVITLSLLGQWILHFFGHLYAENGIGVLRYLVLAMIPFCVNSFFMTINQVKKQISLILLQTGFLAVVSLGLGYWLLLRIGLNGLGMAYALAQLILACIVVWPLWKELKKGNLEATIEK